MVVGVVAADGFAERFRHAVEAVRTYARGFVYQRVLTGRELIEVAVCDVFPRRHKVETAGSVV